MTRSLTTNVDNALQADNIPSLLFVELDFDSGIQRLTNAPYNFDWNGYTWLGAGFVGKVDVIEEGTDLQMYGVAMQLSMVPVPMVSIALGENYQGRSAKIWLSALDSIYNIIADPIGPFNYRMDTMTADIDNDKTATITLTAESRLADWDRPRISRYNNEDQQIKSPGDMFFQFIPQMVNATLVWGRQ